MSIFDKLRELGRCNVTFAGELDNMDKMLIQTELTVIAGDHESYNISADEKQQELSYLTVIT